MSKTEFDIEQYNVEELINIIGMGSEIPLTNEKIVSTVTKFKNKFKSKYKKLIEKEKNNADWKPEREDFLNEEKTSFLKFFNNIQDKLLVYKKDETIVDLFDEEITVDGITRKAIPINSRKPSKAILYDGDVMGETRMTGLKNVNQAPFDNLTQGYKNPILRNTLKRLVVIDSSFRSIINNADSCLSTNNINTTVSQTSTNFTVNLNPPIKNVLEMTFCSANIPNEWHTFSKDYGTNYFIEKKAIIDASGNYTYTDISNVEIKNGDYGTAALLVAELNLKSDRITFSYSEITRKISIINNANYTIQVDWYSLSVPLCSTTGNGGKIDYNLGWLLGFKKTSSILAAGESETGISPLDLVGPTYLYISVDDFNNNKPNQDLVSFQNNVIAFTMPNYYVKTTMGSSCDLTNPEYMNTGNAHCGKKYSNRDLSSNLTAAQRYTMDQIKLTMNNQRSERYSSPNTSNILTKINVQTAKTHTQVEEINLEYKKRVYFGPVNLKKLHIRLVNPFGMDINLNERDWSFSFYVTTIYQQ